MQHAQPHIPKLGEIALYKHAITWLEAEAPKILARTTMPDAAKSAIESMKKRLEAMAAGASDEDIKKAELDDPPILVASVLNRAQITELRDMTLAGVKHSTRRLEQLRKTRTARIADSDDPARTAKFLDEAFCIASIESDRRQLRSFNKFLRSQATHMRFEPPSK